MGASESSNAVRANVHRLTLSGHLFCVPGLHPNESENQVSTERDISTILSELRPWQEKISASESDSIMHRWEFGRVLVAKRGDKKQLPNGIRADLADRLGLEASEITRRMQLAEKFTTADEVVDACTRHGGAWRRIVREELVKRKDDQPKVSSWGDRVKARLDKMMAEAGESDCRHAELVAMLRAALTSLTDDTGTEVAA